MELKTFIFMGRSGCGKGTQADLVVKDLHKMDPNTDVLYVETGLRFRNFIKGQSFTSKLSNKIYMSGELQPSFLAVKMWSDELIEKLNGNEHLILDGTSRKLREAYVLEHALDFYERGEIYVVYLNISREESKKRLLKRGRHDDSDADIEKRLDWYDEAVKPVVDYYEKSPKYEFLDIDGERSIEEIHKDIKQQVFG